MLRFESSSSKARTDQLNRYTTENSNRSRKSSSKSDRPQSSGMVSGQAAQPEKKLKQSITKEGKAVFEFIDGDLFDASEDFSLAHCVGEDLAMGAGIAVSFRKKFHCIGTLQDQNIRTGGVAVLELSTRFVYNLVTKRLSTGKPTMKSLISSLNAMKIHILEHNVCKLAMPEIGSGLDNLDWNSVLDALQKIFCDVDIHIQVYHYKPEDNYTRKEQWNKLVEENIDLVNIRKGTALLYIGYVSGNISESMKNLDTKHNFIANYKSTQKTMGEVIRFEGKHDVIYGFICVDSHGKFSYDSFESCLHRFTEINKYDQYGFVGLSSVISSNDALMMLKIGNIMKYCASAFKVCLCKPVTFPEDSYELLNNEKRKTAQTFQRSSHTSDRSLKF